jgi:hypothetical protein
MELLDFRLEDCDTCNQWFQTDQGKPIAAYRLKPDKQETLRTLSSSGTSVDNSYVEWTIAQSSADPNCNCHGWVFADGQYVVMGRDIESILQDNNYRRVERPESGDIIVYRSADQQITHTGLVKTVAAGLVLIESKWGLYRRYLHKPEHQPYSQQFTYYRSSRAGHTLRSAPPSIEQATLDRRAALPIANRPNGGRFVGAVR